MTSRRRSPSRVVLLGPQAHAGRCAEVGVDDAALAGEDQRVADLVGEGGDLGPGHRALAAQRAGERVAREHLHHVVAEVIGGRAGVEDLDDVVAAQAGQRWASWMNCRARGSAGEWVGPRMRTATLRPLSVSSPR
jgi:hypothetical protein